MTGCETGFCGWPPNTPVVQVLLEYNFFDALKTMLRFAKPFEQDCRFHLTKTKREKIGADIKSSITNSDTSVAICKRHILVEEFLMQCPAAFQFAQDETLDVFKGPILATGSLLHSLTWVQAGYSALPSVA